MTDPFSVLGLEASEDVTDDDVRVAWRRVAAATHPDRDDGGDPAAFAAAAAAYTKLRTDAARRDAVADRRGLTSGNQPRVIRGRMTERAPVCLALRVLAVAGASWLAVVAVGWQPASAAVITGAVTWLLRTGRSDLV